jgi:hypothetical protein
LMWCAFRQEAGSLQCCQNWFNIRNKNEMSTFGHYHISFKTQLIPWNSNNDRERDHANKSEISSAW